MTKRKTLKLRLEIEVDNVSIAEMKQRILGRLCPYGEDQEQTERFEYEKGTMPDPHTKRIGYVHWRTVKVKQR